MDDLQFKKEKLDTKSESFCGAKWYNATIWLGSGMTTSCHHPLQHKIDLEAKKTTRSGSICSKWGQSKFKKKKSDDITQYRI